MADSVVKGALLTVAMRWSDRLIGLVSTLILARLLVPEDFGIIAMASLVIGLADVLLDLGVHIALIQNRSPTQAHYDSAFTLRLIQSLLAAIIVAAGSPWAAGYFHEPRVEPVLQWLALSFVFSACENIGLVTFQKEMRFGADFRFLFLKRMAGFVTTVAAAWLLQSYWALVIGNLAGRAVGIGLSYALHPMRPRLTLEKVGEIFAISQWMLLRGIAGYLDNKLHQIFVGRRESAAVLGAYTLGDEISAMPTSELLAPLNRVLFPAFVKVKDNLAELKRVFLIAEGVQSLIGIPAGVGLALVAPEAVLVLLGEKWLATVPFVEVMALIGIMQAITTSGAYVILTLGKARMLAIYSVVQVIGFASLVLLAIPQGGAMAIAWLRLGVAIAGLASFAVILRFTLPSLRFREILAVVYRPVAAAIVMALLVRYGLATLAFGTLPLLIIKVVAGAFGYALTIVLMWRLAGRPLGAESFLLDKALAFRRRSAIPGSSS